LHRALPEDLMKQTLSVCALGILLVACPTLAGAQEPVPHRGGSLSPSAWVSSRRLLTNSIVRWYGIQGGTARPRHQWHPGTESIRLLIQRRRQSLFAL